MSDLPSRIKKLREEKGLTQRQFAEQFQISPSTIALYEVGKRTPDADTLSKLASFFDVSVDYLLGRTNVRKPEDFNPETIAAMRAPELEGYDDLPDEAKRILRDLIKDVYQRYGKHNKNKGKD